MTFGCIWIAHLYFTNGAYAAEMSSEQHMLHLTLWIRVNVLRYNLVCSSFGMFGTYINFMPWFLYGFGT